MPPKIVDGDPEKLTKREVAHRQLVDAIHLYFGEGDIVSIHTLAAAASQVIADLLKAQEKTSILRSGNIVTDEHRAQFLRALKRPENFFKHADRDPASLLEFKPIATQMLLVGAVFDYHLLTEERFHEGDIYLTWAIIRWPNIWNQESEPVKRLNELRKRLGLESCDRSIFVQALRLHRG